MMTYPQVGKEPPLLVTAQPHLCPHLTRMEQDLEKACLGLQPRLGGR
jgi:hypothetical protein